MRALSKKRAALLRIYAKRRDAYLTANPRCERCGATPVELHHRKGRVGLDLINEAFFCALCSDCHRLVTTSPALAYEQGWSVRRVGAA